MREILFRVSEEQPGLLIAEADGHPLRIQAASLEELQHEAREALIEHFGATHATYQVRLRRSRSAAAPANRIRPMAPNPAACV
jgi:hypothetical protein